MERDDEQLLRHATREIGSYLAIVRDELRKSGLPDSIVDQIIIFQYHQIQASTAVSEVTSLLEKFASELGMENEGE